VNVPFVKLREVVAAKTGTKNPVAAPNVEFTYVDVAGVDNVAKQISEPRVLLGADAPSRARKLIRAGDVIVSTIRPNLNAVAQVPDFLDGQVASTGFCVLRSTDKVLPAYLFYFVRSSSFVASLCGLVAGALYPAVTDNQVLDQLIPLPPIADQQLIVDFLSRAESIVRLRREAQQKAAELVPAIFLEMFGDPAINPKQWPLARIESICQVKTGATPLRERKDFYANGTVPWVKTGEVKNGEIFDAEERITELAVSSTNCKVFPVNTILIAMYGQGQTRGRCGILKVPASTNQACVAILPSQHIRHVYLFELIRLQYERLRAMGRGGNQANLNMGMIKAFEVPIPPEHLQLEFERRIQFASSIIKQQATATTVSQAMFGSLLGSQFNS
jgi:type I restriction enzyme, S subunit